MRILVPVLVPFVLVYDYMLSFYVEWLLTTTYAPFISEGQS